MLSFPQHWCPKSLQNQHSCKSPHCTKWAIWCSLCLPEWYNISSSYNTVLIISFSYPESSRSLSYFQDKDPKFHLLFKGILDMRKKQQREVGKHEVCTRSMKNPTSGLGDSRRDVMGNRFVTRGWAPAMGDFEWKTNIWGFILRITERPWRFWMGPGGIIRIVL